MSVHPPVRVPPIQTSPPPHIHINASNSKSNGKPPPPPPKSPLRGTMARSGSVTRRRGDGKLVTLALPTPLSALDPSTPPVAEAVHTRSVRRAGQPAPPASPTSAMSPGATLAAMRRQTEELRPRYYARPASPLRLQSAKKREELGMKRESSLGRLSRRLSSSVTRTSASVNLTLRKSLRNSLRRKSGLQVRGISSSDVNMDTQGRGLGRRQSIVQIARRESGKLKSILKTPQPTTSRAAQPGAPSSPTTDPDPGPGPGTAAETRNTTESGAEAGTSNASNAPVAPKKVGASWHPPRREVERRQSATRVRSIFKPNPNLGPAVAASAGGSRSKPPVPVSTTKPETKMKTQVPPAASTPSPQRTGENSKKVVIQQDKATFDIVAPVATNQSQEQTQVQVQSQPQSQSQSQEQKSAIAERFERDGRNILSEIEGKRLSAAEARRLIRQHNREYFHSRIWDPALQKDFAGAYRLANGRDVNEDPPGADTGTDKQLTTQPQAQAQATKAKRDPTQAVVGPTPPDKDKNKYAWKRYEFTADEWGRSVRLAMAKLEDKITTEASTDPIKFMKARRESAQLRAWIAAQRRTSEARMSAIAMGRVRPESPFEQAFIAELLRERETEIQLRHSSNPMAEAEKLFREYNNKKNSPLPHYVPFSQYPLLTPLEEIEVEVKQEQEPEEPQMQMPSDERPGPRRRQSVFDEKKAARRAGREYKTLSTSTQLDQLELHEARCCGLWKPKAFVDNIS